MDDIESQEYVGLVRVSTEKQGKSRLGLESGLEDIRAYMSRCRGKLLQVFEEVESGTHKDIMDRPTLLKALALCRRRRAVLLIPKIDRLVRSTEVHTDIKRSGVVFVACDMPNANEFGIDILVAVAAMEGRAISDRTKKALASYKREKHVSKRIKALYPDGVPPEVVMATAGKLGAHIVGCGLTKDGRDRGRLRANGNRRREAAEMYGDLVPEIQAMRAAKMPLKRIAASLNEQGHTTRTGRPWTAVQVKRVLDRAQK